MWTGSNTRIGDPEFLTTFSNSRTADTRAQIAGGVKNGSEDSSKSTLGRDYTAIRKLSHMLGNVSFAYYISLELPYITTTNIFEYVKLYGKYGKMTIPAVSGDQLLNTRRSYPIPNHKSITNTAPTGAINGEGELRDWIPKGDLFHRHTTARSLLMIHHFYCVRRKVGKIDVNRYLHLYRWEFLHICRGY